MTQLHGNLHQSVACSYDKLLQEYNKFEKLPLEQIVQQPLGEIFFHNGKGLEASASEKDYKFLKDGWVEYLRDFKSGQSYGSVALNEVGSKFLEVLDYINSLEKKFKVDPERVEKFRLEVIKTAIQKIGTSARHFIPSNYMGLYNKAYNEFVRQQAEQQQNIHA